MTTFDDLMRAHDPARDAVPEPADAEQLLARITDGGGRRVRTRTRVRRWLPVAAALAAALLLVPGLSGFGGVSAEAEEVLRRAAINAYDPPAAASAYWKVTTVGTSLVGGTVDVEGGRRDTLFLTSYQTVEFVAVDGLRPSWFVHEPRRLIRQVAGPDAAPELNGVPDTWTTDLAPADEPGSWQNPTPRWLAGLPTNPQRLRERVYADAAGHGTTTDGEVFVLIADALRSQRVPAAVRSALFEVLQTVPGVYVVDDTRLADGRSGVALARRALPFESSPTLVMDPASGQVIGEREGVRYSINPLTPEVVVEQGITRELVDAVPAAVQRDAARLHCTVEPNGGTACAKR